MSDIIQASRRQNRTGRHRSEARVWLEDHFDELLETPPAWMELASRLNATGMRDAYGRKLTAHVLTSMFTRIKTNRGSGRKTTHPIAQPEQVQIKPFEIRSINTSPGEPGFFAFASNPKKKTP